MCLMSVLSKAEESKFLKKVADPMTCWKVVAYKHGGRPEPLDMHSVFFHHPEDGYHTGVNFITKCHQAIGNSPDYIFGGAHFFRCRSDAVAMAMHSPYIRRVVRCLIAKKDIDAIGLSSMRNYGPYNSKPALTIVAHRATFAKTIRKVS